MKEVTSIYKHHFSFTERSAEHDHNNTFKKMLRDLQAVGYNGIKGQSILDLGCGTRYSLALQLVANGASVTALDVDYIITDWLPLAFYRIIKKGGFLRAVKAAVRRILFDERYYKTLEKVAGQSLLNFRDKITFVVTEAEEPYPLPDESFDLIVAIAVLEHVTNVRLFASEVKRMLKPGGYFYAIIHNFYSLSGGHHPEWAFPDEHPSKIVPPWDHLRANRFPVSAYLNKLKPEQYLEIFGGQLQVIIFEGRDLNHDAGGLEGESLLTEEVYQELSKYPKDLLLNKAWCMLCFKNE
jgi:SAM-dependent methyltransferase